MLVMPGNVPLPMAAPWHALQVASPMWSIAEPANFEVFCTVVGMLDFAPTWQTSQDCVAGIGMCPADRLLIEKLLAAIENVGA